jgi:beta-glucosidase
MHRLLAVALLAGAGFTLWGQRKPAYQDVNASPEKRAADLVSRMTLSEKVGQMQNNAPAIPRLGIPAYDWWNEALHGVARAGLATVFPQAIGLAATWDTDLLFRVAGVISTEARGKYNDAIQRGDHSRYLGLTFWSPNINIFRDPRWGRGQETYGEDPYLASQMAVAFVKGIQGDNSHYLKAIATPKHFAVHSGPEPLRHGFNVNPSKRDLEDTYLPAFRASVMQGGADSVMCAYNAIGGVPACANAVLLQQKLRGDWKFAGYVVSDCGAISDIFEGHHYTKSMPEAAAAGIRAGTDLSCGDEYSTLAQAVRKGLISETEVDRSLERLFVARFRLGMFDPPERVPFSKLSLSNVDTQAHRELALKAAEKSMVLLKNEGRLLPLRRIPKRIAVLGPTADDPDTLLGNYHGIPSRIVTPLDGIRRKFEKDVDVTFALGSTFTAQSTAPIPENVLSSAAGSGSQQGLRAEYFDNDALTGTPVLSRVEPQGYFRWDMHDPALAGRISHDKFSLRWTTLFAVAQSGDYALGVKRLPCAECKGNDSAQLFLDGKLLVRHEKHASWNPEDRTATVHLDAGQRYHLRVDYRQDGGGAGMELIWKPPADVLLAEAKQEVEHSDLAIVCVGLNSNLEGEESRVKIPGFSGGDRTDLALPEPQKKLLQTVFQSHKPVIVVLLNGSALGVKEAKAHAQAVLEAWYPGQDGGTAIANTLTGDNNPAGRLPVTFYESIRQLPPFTDYSMTGRTYRYFTGAPLYPFGYGLSYSDFRYSDLAVTRGSRAGHEDEYVARARVTNVSSQDGDEVAQLYVGGEIRPDRAIRDLKGFERIHLRAGESRTLQFRFTVPKDRASRLAISIGGGQPLPEWTGDRFVSRIITP